MRYDLNVCLLNDCFPPTIDGVATCTKNYADVIERDLGHACVCTPHYPHVRDDYPYPVFRYPSVNMNRLFGYRAGYPFDKKIVSQLAQWPMDIMHCHCPIISMVLARTIREITHRPIVLSYHSRYEVDLQRDISSNAVREQATRAILANIEAANAVWTVSEGAKRSLRAMGYTGEITVMPNGVDLPRGEAPADAVRRVNEAHGLSPETPVFLFAGRMMWYKGIREILEALRLLGDSAGDYRMLFVGDGLDKEEIVRFSNESGLDGRVIFVTGIRDREQLRAYYTRANMFLFPSDYDTNGLVVHEAAACGTASITLKDSCAAEGVEDGHNGLTVTKDPADLAAACRELLRDPLRMKEMGVYASEELYLSWDDSIRHAYAAYEDVIRDYDARCYPPRDGKSDHFFRAVARLYKESRHRGRPAGK